MESQANFPFHNLNNHDLLQLLSNISTCEEALPLSVIDSMIFNQFNINNDRHMSETDPDFLFER